jgi:outer membrane protein assembly factor BamA
MLNRRQVSVSILYPVFVLSAALFLWSCSGFHHVSKYQYGKPFVFDTKIKVEGDISGGEKKDLSLRLANQLDDSLRIQETSIAGIYKKLVAPPAYDSANVRRSIGYMVALLNASGYYTPEIKDTVHIDTVRKRNHIKDQYRVTIEFTVLPGKQMRLDSIGYDLHTPALQAMAQRNMGGSLLRRGQPYSNKNLSDELDRLVTLFQDSGYYKFTKEDLVIIKDTVVAGLIDPNLDPFQQAALLEELRKKREHPTVNVVVEQRPVKDSSHIEKYYIGHVTVYPDLPILEDTIASSTIDTSTTRGFTIISRTDKFKPSFVTSNIYLRPQRLYRKTNYDRTINRFGQMGAWQQASVGFTPSGTADSLLDVDLRLYPNKKYKLDIGVEASRNTADIVTVGNLFGVGVNLGLLNRNSFHQSVLSNTTLRAGVELGNDFIQTTQASIAHTISFPKLIAPRFIVRRIARNERRLDSLRSVLNLNASYTDRRQFFTVQSFNASWGYQWTRGNRSFVWNPINLEYTKLFQTDSFSRYLLTNPSLSLAFRSGLVVGSQFIYNSRRKIGIHTNLLRISLEESGALLGLIREVDKGDLWRFIKADMEFAHHIDFRRSQLALRAYAGAGWAYGREGKGFEETLPFYKAFFAGGPNSMRGWQIRQLGLGSSPYYDTAAGGKLDRFGDVQLEGNVEYRFPLGTLFGVKLKSAFYMDAGNIWNRHLSDTLHGKDKGSDFKFDRFYKELAVDAGTGLRLDFDYFLIRFDWAYKLKDPQRLENSEKWFHDMHLKDGQFQLGINYPF